MIIIGLIHALYIKCICCSLCHMYWIGCYFKKLIKSASNIKTFSYLKTYQHMEKIQPTPKISDRIFEDHENLGPY
jgi:hypothetical protein